MKIVAYGNNSGTRWWRLESPFKELRKLGHDARVLDEAISEEAIQWADIIVLQSIVDKEGIALAYAYQQEMGKKIVVDMDDWIWQNEHSPFLLEHKLTNAPEVITKAVEIADMVTTTQKYLGDKIGEINKNVVVLPNYIHVPTYDLPKLKNETDEIRIGWAGSVTHYKDMEMIKEPLTKIMGEFPKVKLILIGDLRLADHFKGLNTEVAVGVPVNAWPSKLHSLRLDIGIAPLEDNEFNRCKSNIKWQEYSIAQVPGVFSNTVYQWRGFEPRYGLIAYNNDQWYINLKNLIQSETLREDIANSAYSRVTKRFSLEKHIKEWEAAYESLT